MRIAELSHPIPDLRPPESESPSLQSHLLSQIESSIKQCEDVAGDPPGSRLAEIASDLRRHLSQLSQLAPFGNTAKLQIWKLSYRLWNACVDLSNAAAVKSPPSPGSSAVERARIRHVAADMLFLAGDVAGVPSPAMKAASFYHRTGLAWHDLRRLDLASSCFEKATDLVSRIGAEKVSDAGERKLLFDLHVARSRTAWEVPDKNLAVTLLNRAKNLLYGSSEHYKSLANQFLAFGNSVLSSKSEIRGSKEALKLMNEALDLCEKGLAATRTREAKLEIMELRSKTLRFISAVHLQNEEYESVIKCVKVLREGCDGGDSHPSLPVLAMKAWLGLGRYGDAEKELRGMVVNKGIPEGVWVSAVEAYFQAAGTAGAETAKGVFLGLLGRCHVSAGSAVRVAHRVIGGSGEGSKVRAKVVAELVSDDRVVALFAGEAAAKERKAMQAVLWNCAADHFHMKDYETSAEMFEKSMLYVPYDVENRVTRAKGFRVLCLCHLGMSQLDRAQEYINEAEKLEPNIASSFLKFKIYLQKNDNNGAITQIQAMPSCLDFTPDFLVLSAHEAMACHSLPVAVASLSNLLNFYSLGKPMPLTEVTVLRTLITILTEEAGNEQEALKFMKQARARASDLGPDRFFGKGEVGRRERDWFAVTSWNIGTKSGKARNYGLCSEFFRLASEFYSVLIDGQAEEDNVKVCTSLILTVSAMIASEEQNKDTLSDSEVKQAAEMLDKAGKILPSLNADQISTAEPNLPFTYTSTAYDIHGRLNNTTHQTHLIKTFAASKHCTLNHLLQLGLSASRGPRPNPESATFALNECLSALLSAPSPDYRNVALVVRELIALTSVYKGNTDDEAVLAMYKQAYGVMVGLREGEYPVEEGKWLATTAWNRAALPVRLGQVEAAARWMEMGLEIARKVSRMETCRGCMEDFVKEFGRKVGMNKGEN